MSAPVTKLRTIAAASQVAIQLTNGKYARQLSIPPGWSKVRLGARLHMTNSGADLPGNPTFAMGLCKGLTNIMGDASVTHFVGINTTSLGGNGGHQGATYYFANFTQPAKQVGAVLSEGVDFGAAHKWTIGNQAGVADDVAMVFLDIIKGSPNYTFQMFWNFSATPAQIDLPTFLSYMQPNGFAALANYELTPTQTLPVNEAVDGVLDAINFYFDPTLASMEICTHAFAQIA